MGDLLELVVAPPSPSPRLLVALHGYDDEPQGFAEAVAPLADDTNRVLVVPAGPVVTPKGRAWFPSLDGDDGPGLAEGLDRLVATLAALAPPPDGAPHDTVLLGWSQGAAVALAAVLRTGATVRPSTVVALAPWLANEPDVAWDLSSAPPTRFVIVHGADDPVVPIEQGRGAARVLARAGFGVTIVEVGAAHDLMALLAAARPEPFW
jgi:predicted esterase